MNHQLLYDSARGPMKVVVFASGSGTNFREAVLESTRQGSNFSIELLVTDKQFKKAKPGGERRLIGAIDYASHFKIDYRFVDGFRECGSWPEAQKSVGGIRKYNRRCMIFNLRLLDAIQRFEREKGFVFDFALLAGYMRLFRGPLLRRFNNRAVNMHPATLDELTNEGLRKYAGENAVYDALTAGEVKTRSSVILVDPETDAGAILTSGPWAYYNGKRPVTRQFADAHQEEQKRISDWPAERFTLRAIANGDFALSTRKFHFDGNPVVLYKGEEMPYGGFDLTNT